ncbi:MAG: heme exporter protein CcmB [Phycisphaeraceae bacterium]|nr:heme exporter protein CcmB [Phycisphaeraceae bacterium]
MMLLLRQIIMLTGKDLRIEARSRQTLGLVIVLGILIIVVLGLGLGPEQLTNGASATATLWVAYLFAGVLVFEKTMSVERHDGALASLLLAPIDRSVIYVAKLISNLILMLILALVITPVAVVLFGFDLSAAPGQFTMIMAMSILGFAAVGTLFAAVVSSTRLQGGLLAIVVLPLALPLVIASTQMMIQLFRDGKPIGGTGLTVLLAADVLYLVTSWLVFELILEP